MSDKKVGYLVSNKLEERIIEDRDEAIETAKTWSVEEHMPISVERIDGRVKMIFRNGGLFDYVYETRKGRTA